ncbi:hypothetical protein PPERSA_09186 [Pseudocohnilembus persalinus]|uniref:Uncharacterized protein n=1 Tax=Pseudocohnilembus persalinus TaxID=266149 RepID=A0A0V0QM07_PSEPJ|nr:hypothetical protein PPERSA_09186 [Pseudocohnilembus persalinus]|eukprot:KRX03278.1 hypothetical protein PPERSA_09186 [Pseudocohnilembus persalinus]
MYENDCQEINEKILPIIQRGMVEKTVIPASQKEYEYFLIEEWKKYKGNLDYLIKDRNQLGPDSFVWWNNYKLKYSKLRQIFITQKKDNKFQQYIKDLRQYENDLFETCCNLIQDYQQNYNQNREFNYNANRYRKKQILKEIDYLVSKTQEFEQQSHSSIQIPLENSIITYSNAPTKDQSDQNNLNNRGSLESSQNNQQQNLKLGEVDIQKKWGKNQDQKWQNQVEQLQQSSKQKGVSIQSIYNFSGHCGTSSKKSQKYQSKTMVDGNCQGEKKIRVKNNNNKNNNKINNNCQHINESDDAVEEQFNCCSQQSEGKNRNKSCSLQDRGKDGCVRENFEENLASEGQVFRSVEINEYKNYSQNNNREMQIQDLELKCVQKGDQKQIEDFDKLVFNQVKKLGLIKHEKHFDCSYSSINSVEFKHGEIIAIQNDEKEILARISMGVKEMQYQGKSVRGAYLFDFQFLDEKNLKLKLKKSENFKYSQEKYLQDLEGIVEKIFKFVLKIGAGQQYKCSLFYLAQRFVFNGKNSQKINEEINRVFAKIVKEVFGFQEGIERQVYFCQLNQFSDQNEFIDWNYKLKDGTFCAYRMFQESNKQLGFLEKSYGKESDFYLENMRTEFLGNNNIKGCYGLVTTNAEKQSVAGLYIFEEKDKILMKLKLQNTSSGRIAGMFFEGDEKLQDEMFQILLTNVAREPEIQRFSSLKVNVGVNSQFRKIMDSVSFFVKMGFRPKYIIKSIDNQKVDLSREQFFDPRDI